MQQGPPVAALEPRDELPGGGTQIADRPGALQHAVVPDRQDRAPTARDHPSGTRRGTDDRVALAGAEAFLALVAEDLLDRAAGLGGDHVVGVAELETEARGERPADRGLAGGHEPDQDDAPRRHVCGVI